MITRRQFIAGLVAAPVAPAIVKDGHLMRVKPLVVAPADALAGDAYARWLRHQLQGIANGIALPYSSLAAEFDGVEFSPAQRAIRAGLRPAPPAQIAQGMVRLDASSCSQGSSASSFPTRQCVVPPLAG